MSGYNFEEHNKHVLQAYQNLAKAVLNLGIKERDYWDNNPHGLELFSAMADLVPDIYYGCLDYIYGRRDKNE